MMFGYKVFGVFYYYRLVYKLVILWDLLICVKVSFIYFCKDLVIFEEFGV